MKYATMQDFYEARGGQVSGECDFGVWWYTLSPHEAGLPGHMQRPRQPYYRVSVVHTTGDVYAFNQTTREVELLGTFPPTDDCSGVGRHAAGCSYEQVEAVLEGWAKNGSKPLSWIRHKLEEIGAAS